MRMRLSRRSFIGLDVGPRRIAAVQLAAGSPGAQRRVEAAMMISRSSSLRESAWGIAGEDLANVAEALYRQGFTGNRVVVAAPEGALLSTTLELPPRASGAPIEELALQELARSAKKDADSIEVSSWDVPSPPRLGDTTHMLAVGLAHQDADSLLDAYDAAGLEVEAVDCRCCAMMRACAGVTGDKPVVYSILDLTESSASIAVVHSGIVVYNRPVLEAGLGRLREVLGKELRADEETVDYLMAAMTEGEGGEGGRAIPEATAQTAQRVLDDYLGTVLHELRTVMAYAIHRYGAAEAVGPVLLLGPGAAVPALSSRIRKELDLEARPVSLGEVAVVPRELESVCRDPAMMTAGGLAMRPVASQGGLRRAA